MKNLLLALAVLIAATPAMANHMGKCTEAELKNGCRTVPALKPGVFMCHCYSLRTTSENVDALISETDPSDLADDGMVDTDENETD